MQGIPVAPSHHHRAWFTTVAGAAGHALTVDSSPLRSGRSGRDRRFTAVAEFGSRRSHLLSAPCAVAVSWVLSHLERQLPCSNRVETAMPAHAVPDDSPHSPIGSHSCSRRSALRLPNPRSLRSQGTGRSTANHEPTGRPVLSDLNRGNQSCSLRCTDCHYRAKIESE